MVEKIKSKIATQFKILQRSEQDSTKMHARNKDTELQKHVSDMGQPIKTLRDMSCEVHKIMIDNNIEYEIVGEWVKMTK